MKFDAFVVDSQGEGEELKADGGLVALVEGVFYGFHCQTALTNPRVADYYYFEAEVILGKSSGIISHFRSAESTIFYFSN